MTISPESIEVGKCYETAGGERRQVVEAFGGKVTYLAGRRQSLWNLLPHRHVMTRKTFAAQAEREVPCSHGLSFQPLVRP